MHRQSIALQCRTHEQVPRFSVALVRQRRGLTFEVTSLDEAREALDEPPAGVAQLRRASASDWVLRRRTLSESERRLSRAATQWLLALPRELRPLELIRRHPRIANVMSERWDDTSAILQLLDDLVLDRRGGRMGFPRP